MPHVENFLLNGQKIPGVNDCTGTLSKDGLINNYFRRYGFKYCDRDSAKSRRRGSSLALVMERFRKTGKTGRTKPYNKACADQWAKWFVDSPFTIQSDCFVEIHLVNTVEKYHGSPDVIMHLETGDVLGILGDDKSKKRFADYALLMNEHAYAMCDSFVNSEGLIIPLPWKPPIPKFWFWTYDPDTGELFPNEHRFDNDVWQDFLVCRRMYDVNARAEEYFKRCATLLPSRPSQTAPVSSGSLGS